MKDLGIFGSYSVREIIDAGRFFVDKTEVDAQGNESTTKVPVKKFKRVLELTHIASNVTVTFTAYINRGQWRYKDSRKPKESMLNPLDVISEMVRMLGIAEAEAKAMLGVPQHEESNA